MEINQRHVQVFFSACRLRRREEEKELGTVSPPGSLAPFPVPQTGFPVRGCRPEPCSEKLAHRVNNIPWIQNHLGGSCAIMNFNKLIRVCGGVPGADKSAVAAINRALQMSGLFF